MCTHQNIIHVFEVINNNNYLLVVYDTIINVKCNLLATVLKYVLKKKVFYFLYIFKSCHA